MSSSVSAPGSDIGSPAAAALAAGAPASSLLPPPMNCMSVAWTSSVCRGLPSLSVHSSTRKRPSIYTGLPFVRYCDAVSACRPQRVTRNHVVISLFSPVALSRRLSLVARLKLQTGVPWGVYRNSGSRPRLPTRMILLNDIVSSAVKLH